MRYIALLLLCHCTYDSTPPGADRINDGRPLLMIDATGFSAERSVQIQFTDLTGAATVATSAEKTDASGRFLYPLYMTRGTRSFSLSVRVDENGDGVFTTGGADRKYQLSAAFNSDAEIKNLAVTNTADFLPN